VSYIYADHLNTARVIVRPSDQAILWTWASTEPFGQTLATNPNSATLGAYTYNPRFPGQVFDAESGWFYNWNRDYNPALGRYVQSDPIGLDGGSMSTYGYVFSDPLQFLDPDGLQAAAAAGQGLANGAAGAAAGGYSPMPGRGGNAAAMVNDGPGRGRERETAAQSRSRETNCPPPTDEECRKERMEAENNCFEWIQELKSSRTPAGRKRDLLKLTGGSMGSCIPGQVSQACGGNKVR
jgi:RHS repeat-associated protein